MLYVYMLCFKLVQSVFLSFRVSVVLIYALSLFQVFLQVCTDVSMCNTCMHVHMKILNVQVLICNFLVL
jgi:hypothetical protein